MVRGLAIALALGLMSSLSFATDGKGNLASGCAGTETFVFVPTGTDRQKYLADYVKTHKGPTDAELKQCNLTRDQWRAQVLKSN
jgi:hypothetical protein